MGILGSAVKVRCTTRVQHPGLNAQMVFSPHYIEDTALPALAVIGGISCCGIIVQVQRVLCGNMSCDLKTLQRGGDRIKKKQRILFLLFGSLGILSITLCKHR